VANEDVEWAKNIALALTGTSFIALVIARARSAQAANVSRNGQADAFRRVQNHAIELWDNDGIVNTASMVWPEGQKMRVAADHGHIGVLLP
jgi:hypothetical protein